MGKGNKLYTIYLNACIIYLVILVQEIVECKLVVNSDINGRNEQVIVNGKGYYKKDNEAVTIYFTNEDVKYKYVYDNDVLVVTCNDSCYKFKLNKEERGEIKNGDYVFRITTFATKIEVYNRLIVLEYNLSQNNIVIGKYKSELSF